MKLQLLGILFLMTFSGLGHAQLDLEFDSLLGNGSGFLGLPNKEERRINKCKSTIEKITKKTKSGNAYANCKNVEVSDEITENKDYYIDCISKALKVTKVPSNLLPYCQDRSFMELLKDPAFGQCTDAAKKIGFPTWDHTRIQLCRDTATASLVTDEAFLSCLQFLKIQKPKQALKERAQQCRSTEALEAIRSEGFTTCRQNIAKLGFPVVSVIDFCFSLNNQKPERVKQIVTCTKSLDDLLGPKAGIRYCLGFKEAHLLQDDKVLECFNKTNQSLSPNFFNLKDDENAATPAFLGKILRDCTDPRVKPVPLDSKLQFHAAYYMNSTLKVGDALVGGLSGLTYNADKNLFYVVSDDPGRNDDSRFFTMKADFSNGARFTIQANTYLSSSSIDAESIQIMKNGHFAISYESLSSGSRSLIRIYDQNGKYQEEIPMPKKFKRDSTYNGNKQEGVVIYGNMGEYEVMTGGIQMNRGLESLGIPETNKDVIFTAAEAPLFQDLIKDRSIARIVKLKKNHKGKFEEEAEFAYEMEHSTDNGISDILAMDEERLFVLERQYDVQKDLVTAKIFEVDLKGAVNISEVESFKKEAEEKRVIQTVRKKLILNLDHIVPQLPAGLRRVDNVEGMALGPKLPSGNRSLVLVTDNNFSEKQLNQFIVLELMEK